MTGPGSSNLSAPYEEDSRFRADETLTPLGGCSPHGAAVPTMWEEGRRRGHADQMSDQKRLSDARSTRLAPLLAPPSIHLKIPHRRVLDAWLYVLFRAECGECRCAISPFGT